MLYGDRWIPGLSGLLPTTTEEQLRSRDAKDCLRRQPAQDRPPAPDGGGGRSEPDRRSPPIGRPPRDRALLEELASQIDAALIIIDPLTAFVTSDTNSDQKVRWALMPLKDLAERTDTAIVLVRHLTKRGGAHALYRCGGFIGIVAAARSALLVGRSPDDPDMRVICHVKSNLGPLAPSLLFEPVSGPEGHVRVEWWGRSDYTAGDLLDPPRPGKVRLAEATSFLRELLSGGPVEQKVIKPKAIEEGLAYRTIERAKEVLGVMSRREGWGPGSQCYWQLPSQEVRPA